MITSILLAVLSEVGGLDASVAIQPTTIELGAKPASLQQKLDEISWSCSAGAEIDGGLAYVLPDKTRRSCTVIPRSDRSAGVVVTPKTIEFAPTCPLDSQECCEAIPGKGCTRHLRSYSGANDRNFFRFVKGDSNFNEELTGYLYAHPAPGKFIDYRSAISRATLFGELKIDLEKDCIGFLPFLNDHYQPLESVCLSDLADPISENGNDVYIIRVPRAGLRSKWSKCDTKNQLTEKIATAMEKAPLNTVIPTWLRSAFKLGYLVDLPLPWSPVEIDGIALRDGQCPAVLKSQYRPTYLSSSKAAKQVIPIQLVWSTDLLGDPDVRRPTAFKGDLPAETSEPGRVSESAVAGDDGRYYLPGYRGPTVDTTATAVGAPKAKSFSVRPDFLERAAFWAVSPARDVPTANCNSIEEGVGASQAVHNWLRTYSSNKSSTRQHIEPLVGDLEGIYSCTSTAVYVPSSIRMAVALEYGLLQSQLDVRSPSGRVADSTKEILRKARLFGLDTQAAVASGKCNGMPLSTRMSCADQIFAAAWSEEAYCAVSKCLERTAAFSSPQLADQTNQLLNPDGGSPEAKHFLDSEIRLLQVVPNRYGVGVEPPKDSGVATPNLRN